MLRDCNTCRFHQQGENPALVVISDDFEEPKITCQDCLEQDLKHWCPKPGVVNLPPVKVYGKSPIAEHSADLESLARASEKPAASEPEKPDFAAISERRKGMPVFSGFMMYFPDATLAVAEHSRKNNDKHNPGQPLHWSKGKSSDHADCIARHLIDIGPDWDAVDPESGSLHAQALAWRAMALLQIVLEAQRAGMKPREYIAKLKAETEALK